MFYKNISKRCLPPDPFAVVGRWMLSRPLGEACSPLEPLMSLEEGAMAAGSRHFNAKFFDDGRSVYTLLAFISRPPRRHPFQRTPRPNPPSATTGGAPKRARGPSRDCQHGAAVARGHF